MRFIKILLIKIIYIGFNTFLINNGINIIFENDFAHFKNNYFIFQFLLIFLLKNW